MDRIKMCDICGIKIARFMCKKCGSDVCEDHYDKKTGLCTVCSAKL